MTRWYPRIEVDSLVARGRIKGGVLTINLPEPGGAVVREDVRVLEDARPMDLEADPHNPYLRDYGRRKGWYWWCTGCGRDLVGSFDEHAPRCPGEAPEQIWRRYTA